MFAVGASRDLTRITGYPEVIYADDERANNSGIPDQPENLL